MIDIKKAIEEFTNYTHSFDMSHYKIKYKHDHSLSTMKKAKQIAKSLSLSEEDIAIAELVGLLHDLGRFYQIEKYQAWVDAETESHGDLGIEYLFEQGNIKRYIETRKYDDIIKAAIENHNVLTISDDLKERELLHAKIIRDADKLDIFYQRSINATSDFNNECHRHQYIRDEIFEEALADKPLVIKPGMNNVELSIALYCFIPDLYFPFTRRETLEKDYLKQILEVSKPFINERVYEQTKILVDKANDKLRELIKMDEKTHKGEY